MLSGVRRAHYRCEDWADGLAPPDLPRVEAPKLEFTRKMKRLTDAIAATDWKARAAGK